MLVELRIKNKELRILVIVFLILFLLTGCGQETETIIVDTGVVKESIDVEDVDINQENIELENELEETTIEIPTKLELDVDFVSQAPFANWDELHKEACEEASMITVAKYFNGELLNESIMEEEIQKLVAWEEENGYKIDLTAQESANILENYFDLSARIENRVTVDQIKYELNQGNLIIIPAAGRDLGNPYFQTPGPIYHMLVIKGYDSDEFITNDVGTKRGDGFKYKYDQLISAIHDWNHELSEDGMTDEEMRMGEKVMIIISK